MRCPDCGSRNVYTVKGLRSQRAREWGRGKFRMYRCNDCQRRFPTMEFPVVSQRDAEAAESLS